MLPKHKNGDVYKKDVKTIKDAKTIKVKKNRKGTRNLAEGYKSEYLHFGASDHVDSLSFCTFIFFVYFLRLPFSTVKITAPIDRPLSCHPISSSMF